VTANPLRDAYVGDSIATASPARLLVMLYDRLLVDLAGATQAIAAKDIGTASSKLCHAQDIVMELRTSLDTSAWEGGPGLASLYDWLYQRLVQANVAKDTAIVAECVELVAPLRDAWNEAALATATGPTVGAGGRLSATA
jgi:flagellar secretion chaperone FliS